MPHSHFGASVPQFSFASPCFVAIMQRALPGYYANSPSWLSCKEPFLAIMQRALQSGPHALHCPSERKNALPCSWQALPVVIRYGRIIPPLYLPLEGLQLGPIQADLLHKARLLHDMEGEQG